MKKWVRKLLCLIGDHDWTCAAGEGYPPSEHIKTRLKVDPAGAFYEYARMYCKACGHMYKGNRA